MLQNFFKPMQGSQGEKVSKKHPDNKTMSLKALNQVKVSLASQS